MPTRKKRTLKPRTPSKKSEKKAGTLQTELTRSKRQLEVEASLERIRSRTMKMRTSDELAGVISVVFNEALKLGFGAMACDLVILNRKTSASSFWISGERVNEVIHFVMPKIDNAHYRDGLTAWIKRKKLRAKTLKGRSLTSYRGKLIEHGNLPKAAANIIKSLKTIHHTEAYMRYGYFRVASEKPLAKEEENTLKRFAQVFEQTYTRFLDLKKAEAQASEAKIEAALERVRSRSMAMHHSSELSEVVIAVYNQLNDLGFNISDGAVAILEFEEGSRDHTQWIVDPYHTYPTPFRIPYSDHSLCVDLFKAKESGASYLSRLYSFREKNEYFKFLFANNPDYKSLPKDVKMFLLKSKEYGISVAFSKYSAILIPTNKGNLLPEENKEILLRFSRVFDQAYTRFLDLQKAEAQAREAQIEAALERVRARAMAMHHSDELQQVAYEMRTQLGLLGQSSLETCAIHIYDESSDYFTSWAALRPPQSKGKIIQLSVRIPTLGVRIVEEALTNYRSGKRDYVLFMDNRKLTEWYGIVKKLSPEGYSIVMKSVRKMKPGKATGCWVVSDFSGGSLVAAILSEPDENSKLLLRRFANVFDLAYKRFVDLQQAEAQAREAQIEVAVERVRAKALAMHKSEDIISVVRSLRQELENLQIPGVVSTTIYLKQEDGRIRFWDLTTIEELNAGDHTMDKYLRLEECPDFLWFQRMFRAKEKYMIVDQEKKELKRSMKWIGQNVSEEVAASMTVFFEENNAWHMWHPRVLLQHGVMNIDFIQPPPAEVESILIKMGAAFDLAHKRFLDLQKAETQAREAQIEVALERVRSRTMAMHNSSELIQTAELLFDQLTQLGAESQGVAFAICDKDSELVTKWTSIGVFSVPYTFEEGEQRMYEAWKSQVGIYEEIYEGERVRKYYELFMQIPEFKEGIQKFIDSGIPIPTWQKNHAITFKYGYLLLITTKPFLETEIFLRFAKVFEQTYTRFLDLQKAEAQAREAQIETALEKIRSRSLAMHKSDELKDVVVVVFENLKKFGLQFDVAGIQLFTEGSRDILQWVAAPGLVSAPVLAKLPYSEKDFLESKIIRDVWAAKENGKSFHNNSYSFEEKNIFFQYAARHNDLETIPAHVREFQMLAPGYTQSLVAEKHSALWVDSYSNQTISVDEFSILERCARVFEQAYIRFLDLQKAEAQAREAQIEAALERVRSRSMAMHKSDELTEVASMLFREIRDLGIKAWTTGFNIWSEDNNSYIDYVTDPEGNCMEPYTVDTTLAPVLSEVREARKSGREFFVNYEEGEAIKETYRFLMSFGEKGQYEKLLESGFQFPTQQYNHFVFGKKVSLLFITYEPVPEAHDIFKRFGKVFEQTYTRFLDLQKAEAQAREGQIQLAMERVRARTMAMQKSDELPEAANLLFQQVQSLGMPAWSAGYCIWDDDKKAITLWMSSEGVLQPPFKLPLTEDPSCIHFLEAHQRGETFYVEEVGGEALVSHYKYMRSLPVVGEVLQSINDAGFPLPTFQIFHCAYFSKGFLLFITYESVPEAHNIFKRFGKVFEQTYTRFLDLQKAEAQAREAQIEAALERVRSASLAMHHSDDLEKVVSVLSQRLEDLELAFDGTLIFIFDKDKRNITLWIATVQLPAPLKVSIPYDADMMANPVLVDLWNAIEKKENNINKTYTGKVKDDYFRYVARHNRETISEELQQLHLKLPAWSMSYVAEKNSVLAIDSWSGHVIGEKEFTILSRFAVVFEQAYTRFLDLQKAEAQAREAQIEAALERVRSRSMAMQRTEDLRSVVKEVYAQLKSLGFKEGVAAVQIIDEATGDMDVWMEGFEDGYELPERYHVPYFNHPEHNRHLTNWKNGEQFAVMELSGDEKKSFDNYFFSHTDFAKAPEQTKLFMMNQDALVTSVAYMRYGSIGWAPTNIDKEQANVLQRVAKVFEQTYTRFFDLQKAEAQAREAQIEAALERVRARTMAMHSSSELIQTAELLFDQLKQLGAESQGVAFAICDNDSDMVTKWTSIGVFSVPYTFEDGEQQMYEAWKNQVGIYEKIYEGESLRKYYELFMQIPAFKEGIQKFIDSGNPIPTWQKNHAVTFKYGYLLLITLKPFAETEIFLRFAKVFEQTYTRFLDLQKAEAQAREAQIEAALERVRSRTMAMHKSEDILEVIRVMTEQFIQLGFELNSVNISTTENRRDYKMWLYGVNAPPYPHQVFIPWVDHPIINQLQQAFETNSDFLVMVLTKEEKNRFYNHLFSNTFLKHTPEERKAFLLATPGYAGSFALNEKTIVTIVNFQGNPFTAEQNLVLKRFSTAFEQSYIRFLDLQKAEAQAREAQIEAALERVRAQAMAMHHTEDLGKTIRVYFEQLHMLLNATIVRCGAGLLNKENTIAEMSTASKNPDGETYDVKGFIDMKGHPLLEGTYKHWLKQEEYRYVLRGNEIREYNQYITDQVAIPENKGEDELYFYFPMFSEGSFYLVTNNELPENELQIFRRFSSVLSLTYRRFNDLQKAEAQAREAQIEAALERVRSRSMAMHKSEELLDVITVVLEQLQYLNFKFNTVSFAINSQEHDYTFWFAIIGDPKPVLIHVPYLKNPMFDRLKEVHAQRLDFYADTLTPEENREWHEHVLTHAALPMNEETKAYVLRSSYARSIAIKPSIMLVVSNYAGKPYSDSENEIIKRFATVFEQSYTRFLDLQKAEAREKEAIKQSSLDRVRAEIASMRTANDLDRIIPLVWKELTTLGIPFVRCGVFIMDEEQNQIHTHLSTPDGRAIAAFHLPMDEPGNLKDAIHYWREHKPYIAHWVDQDFQAQADMLVKQGAIAKREQYLSLVPKEGIYLHLLPFLHGMLYVGNTGQLSSEDITLVQSLADAFSVAYARYEDFRLLEEAKNRIETALHDLKATQSQLIQSEKMASLGELTAGIAHEIQNPLNFVNNFSEVSKELLEEMKDELDKGNADDAKAIALDIIQNLEKITFHGKRADGIVKSMLQHSRKGSGQKELTDLNALCDEYLRLAYHGLRAKDKSFNAKFEAHLDSSPPKINVLPQEIGRVVLNLINNAFYAVSERQKSEGKEFEPIVTVSTKNSEGKIEVRVRDNGTGIPQHVLDKIFQPFFTTKPTGQGTGLGLSLSYDIIKAHGGELRVETKEGEGSEFSIQLPIA